MSNTQTFDVGGRRIELDLKSATRIETLSIGAKVKVLDTTPYSGPKVWPGVIVGFEPFEKMPTIIVAYIEGDWGKAELKFLHYNSKCADKYELVVADVDTADLDRELVSKHFAETIRTHEVAIEDLKQKRDYFERNFRAYWQQVQPVAEPEAV